MTVLEASIHVVHNLPEKCTIHRQLYTISLYPRNMWLFALSTWSVCSRIFSTIIPVSVSSCSLYVRCIWRTYRQITVWLWPMWRTSSACIDPLSVNQSAVYRILVKTNESIGCHCADLVYTHLSWRIHNWWSCKMNKIVNLWLTERNARSPIKYKFVNFWLVK